MLPERGKRVKMRDLVSVLRCGGGFYFCSHFAVFFKKFEFFFFSDLLAVDLEFVLVIFWGFGLWGFGVKI